MCFLEIHGNGNLCEETDPGEWMTLWAATLPGMIILPSNITSIGVTVKIFPIMGDWLDPNPVSTPDISGPSLI